MLNEKLQSNGKYATIDQAVDAVKLGKPKPRLLLHVCCAPCACGVLDAIASFFDITLFFYNPNIMPQTEFNMRLSALKTLLLQYPDIKLVVPEQSVCDFTSKTAGFEHCLEGGERCAICFDLRLNGTAEYLATHSDMFDCFATTLTVSPHKDATRINAIGERIAAKFEVDYLCSNFKKKNGYLRSIQISVNLGLYRQDYCGCRF